MIRLVKEARIVITHGGPSSFIMPLQIGKIPIVVPRQSKYGEHINDHQVKFCKEIEERIGNILVVNDIECLARTIEDYESIVQSKDSGVKSNNSIFCEELGKIVEDL